MENSNTNIDQKTESITTPIIGVTVNTVAEPAINLLTGEIVDPNKQRHFLIAFFLSFTLGVFGADRFYLGKIWTGILKFLTFGGMGIWALTDLNAILSGNVRDKQGNKLLDAERYRKSARKTVIISSFLIVVAIILFMAIVSYVSTTFIQNGGLNELYQSIKGNNQSLDIDQLREIYGI